MEQVLATLEGVHEKMQNPANWTRSGLCCHYYGRPVSELYVLMAQWSGFSGSYSYPIGANTQHAEQQYFDVVMTDEGRYDAEATHAYMWDRENSSYAKQRWDLLEFMIATVEEIIRKQAMLKELEFVKELVRDPDEWTVGGICDVYRRDSTELYYLFKQWPEYSGDDQYPVGEDPENARSLFHDYFHTLDVERMRMWDANSSDYAAARHRLLDFMIDTLKKELGQC